LLLLLLLLPLLPLLQVVSSSNGGSGGGGEGSGAARGGEYLDRPHHQCSRPSFTKYNFHLFVQRALLFPSVVFWGGTRVSRFFAAVFFHPLRFDRRAKEDV
jgi:hypothetical protein